MLASFRGVTVADLGAVLAGALLTQVRVPDPAALVRGVVMHTPGDPAPEPDLLALCSAPDAELPPVAAVAVRQADLAEVLTRVPPDTAVFTIPDGVRFSDLYDRAQLTLRDSFGQLAADDAFQLADTLAAALGGAVAIEDSDRRVVAFSTIAGQPIDDVRRRGILGRHVPEHVERTEWYARLWRQPGVCEFPPGAETTARLAVAVRAGAEPVGSIWVVGSRETLSPDADEILHRAVGMVAACLTYQDHFVSRSRRTRSQVVGQLLAGGGGGAPLGDVLPGRTVLAGVRLAGSPAAERTPVGSPDADRAPDADRELLATRLADALSLHAHRYRDSVGLAAAVDDQVYALLPPDDRPRLDRLLRGALARLAPATGWVVVSPVVTDPGQLPRAREQVDRLLGLRQRRGDPAGTVVHVPDAQQELALAALADAVRQVPELRQGTAAGIDIYDSEHGTSYVATLAAWFDACGDVKSAAAALHVHPNTFRYRLTRAQELFGVRLDAADDQLLLHLQLRLRDFW